MKVIVALVVLAVLSVALTRAYGLRSSIRMSTLLDKPKNYGISSAYWKNSAAPAAPVAVAPAAVVVPAATKPPRSYGIGKSAYWKGMSEPVTAPAATAPSVASVASVAIPDATQPPRNYGIGKAYWKGASASAATKAPRSYGIGKSAYWKGMTEPVTAPVVENSAPTPAAPPAVKAPRSYAVGKTAYWKSDITAAADAVVSPPAPAVPAPVAERVVPEAVMEKKEPLKSVVKQTPVTPAPTGAPRSYGISKRYWASGAAAAPVATPTPATEAPAPAAAAAAAAPRSYGISKQYWKTTVAEASPAASAAVEEEEAPAVSTAATTSASTDAALPRRSYGISKPYWKKSSSGIDARTTLQTLLSSRSSAEKKEQAFAPLRRLRQENIQEYELLVDEMFALVDSIEGNRWCKNRLPFALPSFRTKLGSLKRTLDSTTADQSKNGRKRGLLIALGALVKQPGGVRALEKAAMKGKKEVSMREMLARTPENLETPSYAVVDEVPAEVASRAWEVRKYDDFTVCSIETEMQTGSSGSGGSDGAKKGPAGFNTLAGYIFGKNKEATKMSMTTPVLTTEDRMSFVMPPDYWDAAKLAQAPTPMDAGITLEKPLTSSQTLAVLWFSGYALAATAEERKKELLALVGASEKWSLASPEARPYLMQYNDPFVVPWKRRNEVAVPVVPK